MLFSCSREASFFRIDARCHQWAAVCRVWRTTVALSTSRVLRICQRTRTTGSATLQAAMRGRHRTRDKGRGRRHAALIALTTPIRSEQGLPSAVHLLRMVQMRVRPCTALPEPSYRTCPERGRSCGDDSENGRGAVTRVTSLACAAFSLTFSKCACEFINGAKQRSGLSVNFSTFSFRTSNAEFGFGEQHPARWPGICQWTLHDCVPSGALPVVMGGQHTIPKYAMFMASACFNT